MIESEKANYTIIGMCRLLEVDRRRFYEWRERLAAGRSVREERRDELARQIVGFHAASDGTYGSPRVLADLRDADWKVSKKTVAKIMAELGLCGISPRSWHPTTTVPGADPFPISDLVNRQFDKGQRDVVWFSDITYLRTGQGWAYLCVVRDGHTRRVLGRIVAAHMRASMVEAALKQALILRGQLPRKIIFHADRGCQGGFNWSSQHVVVGLIVGAG